MIQRGAPFNFCSLIAGSEGTLFFATEIKLQLHPLPPKQRGVICAHFDSLEQALQATTHVMRHEVFACELIDHYILEGAARNREQQQNLTFLKGEPQALLLIDVRADSAQQLEDQKSQVVESLKRARLGYAYPFFRGELTAPVWAVRKAGLGIVGNCKGDAKPVTLIEDTAVALSDLTEYSMELQQWLRDQYQISCVYYGHAGAGELHIRPILNLKKDEDIKAFREIAVGVADLVKRYNGSLSGEHGDGRLRGELLARMIGQRNYQLLCDVKALWDPDGVFNPEKSLLPRRSTNKCVTRESPESGVTPGSLVELETVFDFSETGGMLRAAEMCNGTGECRKTHLSGGTMCPSYMATREEKDSTRGRANIMRQVLTEGATRDALNNQELKQVMDLCLSCKGCKRECPTNVDVAKLKAEFLQAYHDANGVPLRTRLIASLDRVHWFGSFAPWLHNFMISNRLTSSLVKRISRFHQSRDIPTLSTSTLRRWFARRSEGAGIVSQPLATVYLFCDEFTNYLDAGTGIAAIELLEGLGYRVRLCQHIESGRAAISKGLLRRAKSIAEQNVRLLSEVITDDTPLIGIEPSAVLTLKDEYLDLVGPELAGAGPAIGQSNLADR